MARIALDAMGGDHAPTETVAGAVAAAREGADIVLVGDEQALSEELVKHREDLPIVHAPDVIGMGDEPARAVRERPQSSVVSCARLVSSGYAAGFVSAGSTGAAMAAAALVIGRIPGVLRPTIASIFPTPPAPKVVLDSGANPEVKPAHLLQFGIMGSIVSEVYFGITNPRVGLLNNGEEPSKGRHLEREAWQLLAASESVNFVGNVEGRAVGTGECDVIVTDGFTGNIFLKTTEGTASLVTRLVMDALGGVTPEAQSEILPVLTPIREQLDYESIGGAHLVGTAGVVVIAHGASSRKSIVNALRMAREGAEKGLPQIVARRIEQG